SRRDRRHLRLEDKTDRELYCSAGMVESGQRLRLTRNRRDRLCAPILNACRSSGERAEHYGNCITTFVCHRDRRTCLNRVVPKEFPTNGHERWSVRRFVQSANNAEIGEAVEQDITQSRHGSRGGAGEIRPAQE